MIFELFIFVRISGTEPSSPLFSHICIQWHLSAVHTFPASTSGIHACFTFLISSIFFVTIERRRIFDRALSGRRSGASKCQVACKVPAEPGLKLAHGAPATPALQQAAVQHARLMGPPLPEADVGGAFSSLYYQVESDSNHALTLRYKTCRMTP